VVYTTSSLIVDDVQIIQNHLLPTSTSARVSNPYGYEMSKTITE
jgi:hypothetical protein